MGFLNEISWPEMKSTAKNDDKRVKQTMPLYFKHVAISRDKHYPYRSVCDALRICCFNITISWKEMFSIKMDPCMQFQSSKGLEKILT